MPPSSIAVLGCRVTRGRPSAALRRRLDTALEQRRIARSRGFDPLLICLGGGPGPRSGPGPEAEVMAHYLRSRGVPSDQIIIEPYSRTTEENILHLRAILAHPHYPRAFAGVSPELAPDPRAGAAEPDPPLPVVIVTSATHLPRTLLMCRALGLRPIGIPAPPDVTKLPLAIIRELGAMAIWGARAARRYVEVRRR